ncbi:hypothetical protein OPV22_015567 [Ensete ventricosum]|uniref:Uncharacterized protein n=1 Tax=Ensete ventricosum TaxID=4639 RepID=A0AAV8REI4_ENSVE|nr:hypothetical protein OPV22_015567 [Ensete ventricosum]
MNWLLVFSQQQHWLLTGAMEQKNDLCKNISIHQKQQGSIDYRRSHSRQPQKDKRQGKPPSSTSVHFSSSGIARSSSVSSGFFFTGIATVGLAVINGTAKPFSSQLLQNDDDVRGLLSLPIPRCRRKGS